MTEPFTVISVYDWTTGSQWYD